MIEEDVREMFTAYTRCRTWTLNKYMSSLHTDSAYITSGLESMYQEGKNCPFTAHKAIISNGIGFILVTGRAYNKPKWISRVSRILRTDTVLFYNKDETLSRERWDEEYKRFFDTRSA